MQVTNLSIFDRLLSSWIINEFKKGKVKSTLPGTMLDVWKWAKSVQKNWIHLFVIFANEK